ncbi:MAG: hypothetical protein AAFZ15_23780 [Bacteroidota bacterium]
MAQFIHIILAVSVLFSTTGILLGEHHCQKELRAVQDLTDSSSVEGRATCGPDGCEKGCCSTDYEYFQSDQDKYQQTLDLPAFSQNVLLATIFSIHRAALPAVDKNTLHYLKYRPPIVAPDISVLLQTFLI